MADAFITPEWKERLQLVLHLLNSAERAPYVRGPGGAGKSSFGALLRDALDDGVESAWVEAGADTDLEQRAMLLHDGIAFELGDTLDLLPGPVLLVDDAHRLTVEQLEAIPRVKAAGARIVLFGEPVPDWDDATLPLQYVDLPPLSEPQLAELLVHLGYPSVPEGDLTQLHTVSGGYPGRLLRHLEQQHRVSESEPVSLPERPAPVRSLRWGIGLVVLTAVALLLLRSDWFADAPETVGADSGVAPPTRGAEPATPPVPAQGLPETGKKDVSEQTLTETSPASPEPLGYDAWTMPPLPPDDVPFQEIRFAAVPPTSAGPVAPKAVPVTAKTSTPAPSAQAPTPAAPEPIEAAKSAPAKPAPTKVAKPAPAKSAKPEPTRVARSKPAKLAKPGPADPGLAWLRRQEPRHYTLQLVGARERVAVQKFIEKHKISAEHAVFERDLDGKPWYSLVVGDYPDRDRALAAKARLAPALRGSAWPRTFASIFAQLSTPQ